MLWSGCWIWNESGTDTLSTDHQLGTVHFLLAESQGIFTTLLFFFFFFQAAKKLNNVTTVCLVALLKFICNVTCLQVLPYQKGPRFKPGGKLKVQDWVQGTKMEASPSLCYHECKHPCREPKLSTAEQRIQQPREGSTLGMQNKTKRNKKVRNSQSLDFPEKNKEQWKRRSFPLQWVEAWGLWTSSSIALSAGSNTCKTCIWLPGAGDRSWWGPSSCADFSAGPGASVSHNRHLPLRPNLGWGATQNSPSICSPA